MLTLEHSSGITSFDPIALEANQVNPFNSDLTLSLDSIPVTSHKVPSLEYPSLELESQFCLIPLPLLIPQ